METIVKLASVAAGIFTLAKVFFEITSIRRVGAREEYKFAKEFLSDVATGAIHPFAKEKGYLAISGDRGLKSSEVEYLLSLHEPEKALQFYVLGRAYLKHLPHQGNLQIDFAPKYQRKRSRTIRIYFYTFVYGTLVFTATTPLIFSRYISSNIGNILALFAILASTLFPIGILALREAIKIHRAGLLVRNQSRHTKAIIVGP
ncbi:hypothetical protein [Cupriavidus alkaliphilus]|uniref:hypothetical protein n=1 Tax=Cupriavidus alkaliphilus TaxID=942866 RepID=UPI001614EA19|nr:hypothetical protein [Cupriavidus alkaliphilus]MBB2918403.1 hypothetical protein [Cupriavidus alkaliphilus]